MSLDIDDVPEALLRLTARPYWIAKAGIAAFALGIVLPAAAAIPSSPSPAASPPNGYDCLIEPAQTVELGTPVTGMVEKVLVQRGDRVKHAQVLAGTDLLAAQTGLAVRRD